MMTPLKQLGRKLKGKVPLQRYTVSLYPAQWEMIERLSEIENRSRSEVIRNALDDYLGLRK